MPRRSTIAHLLGSLAVAWIAASMLVAAAPGSATMAKIYPFFRPFLDTFDLRHDWGFFAPDPGTGHVVRYEVRGADDATHAFALTEELHRFDPAYFRLTTLYTKASTQDSDYAAGAVRFLCRRHADLDPVEVRLVVAHQRAVTPDAFLDGVDPMADLDVRHRPWSPCPPEDAP